ncbi:LuxR C-terminal-related transcriptional regulator [Dactylosporangium sp. CA-233914]|uniref:helix-turn-helix transcriptional regulator n=1 Tax=Dactylosporangium sp. CA-233914 TaxID=3239934 RepID=UPI003D91B0BB
MRGVVTLSERKSELVLFDEIHAATALGRGAVLLVSGAVGSGKTALLQAMAEHVGRQGGAWFMVTTSADERSHPYGLLDRLIQAMGAAGMRNPYRDGGTGDNRDFFATMDSVCAAICDFAGGRAAIGIDDVHFADEQSLRCLSYLIRRIEHCGVVVVLNERSSSEWDTAGIRADIVHLPFCHQIRLAPLTPAAIREQLEQRLGGAPDEVSVRVCADVSGGNPLLLHALIDDRAAEPGPSGGEPGASFRQAVLRVMHRCEPTTAVVAQAMAILGEHATSALIAEFAGPDVALVQESIHDLHEMCLLDAGQFRHEQTRAAVLASIPLTELPALRSRAAELLYEIGAPASAVAEQLVTAHDGGKAAWRVAILCEAARQAMAAGDVGTAVNCLRYAAGASCHEAQRAQVGVQLAEALWHADPSRAARRLRELSRDARAGLLTAPDILTVVDQLLWWGEFAEADELLRLGEIEAEGLVLARLWAFLRTAALGSELREEPGRPGDSPLAYSGPMAAATLLSAEANSAFDGMTTSRADRLLLGIGADTSLSPALYALVLLVQAGRLDELRVWCDRLLKEDWIVRVPMRRALIGTVSSLAALRGGDSVAALGSIREVLDAVPPAAWGVVAGLPLSVAIRGAIDLGDAQSARSYLAVPVPPTMFDTPFALPYLHALGRYHLAMGDPRSAVTHFQSCIELMTRWQAGEAGIAAAMEWQREAAGTLAEPGHGAGAASGAGRSARSGESPRGKGWGRRREFRPAADLADSALTGETAGAKLTYAERRVAALAAAGKTNRQIAEYLFVTVSTVEQHLTKTYRKLNVRSRSGLRRCGH